MGQPETNFSTCRNEGCGRPIVWKRIENPSPSEESILIRRPLRWTHHPEKPGEDNVRCPDLQKTTTTPLYWDETQTRTETTGPVALPLSYCAEDSYSRSEEEWVMCNRPARNRTATKGTPVCGMHVRKLTQSEAEEEAREQAAALREWERSERKRQLEEENSTIQAIVDTVTTKFGLKVEARTSGYGEDKKLTTEFRVDGNELLEALERASA